MEVRTVIREAVDNGRATILELEPPREQMGWAIRVAKIGAIVRKNYMPIV